MHPRVPSTHQTCRAAAHGCVCVCLQGSAGLKGTEGPPGPPGPAVSRRALSLCPSLLQLLCYSLVDLVFSFSLILLLHTLGLQWVQWLSLYDMNDLQYIFSTRQTLELTFNFCFVMYVLEIRFVYYFIHVLEWVLVQKKHQVFNIHYIQKLEFKQECIKYIRSDSIDMYSVTKDYYFNETLLFFFTFCSSKNYKITILQQKALISFHNMTVLLWSNK